MPGKRDAHERLPELIAAALHVFTREGYPLARMSDVPAEMACQKPPFTATRKCKEGPFVPAIRHSLLLEDLPAGDLKLSPAPLAATVRADTAVDAPVHDLFPAGAVAAGGR